MCTQFYFKNCKIIKKYIKTVQQYTRVRLLVYLTNICKLKVEQCTAGEKGSKTNRCIFV